MPGIISSRRRPRVIILSTPPAAPLAARVPRAALIAALAGVALVNRSGRIILNSGLPEERKAAAIVPGTPLGIWVSGRRNPNWLPHPPLFGVNPRVPANVMPVVRARRPPPDGRGYQALLTRLPPATQRQDAFNEDAIIVRRDERRYPGLFWANRVPAATIRQDSFNEDVIVARRDERRARGIVWSSRVPAATIRQGSFNEDVIVVRRDERRYPGAVSLSLPHRAGVTLIAPFLGKETVQVIRRDERRARGVVWFNRVPAATIRQEAFNERAIVVKRDERRYPGAVLLQRRPPATVRLDPVQENVRVVRRDERRYAGSVTLNRAARIALSGPPRSQLVRRDERRFAGSVWANHVPDRTVRLSAPLLALRIVPAPLPPPQRGRLAFISHPIALTSRLSPVQTAARVYWRDDRLRPGRIILSGPHRPNPTSVAATVTKLPVNFVRVRDRSYQGGVWANRVPAATQRQESFNEDVTVVRRDERRYSGFVWQNRTPKAPAASAPKPTAALIVRGFPNSPRRPVTITAARRTTFVLTSGPEAVKIVRRQNFRFNGSAAFIQPPREQVVFPAPRNVMARRDERRFAGFVWRVPPTKQNAVAVMHGNPRATVVLRGAPTAVLTYNQG